MHGPERKTLHVEIYYKKGLLEKVGKFLANPRVILTDARVDAMLWHRDDNRLLEPRRSHARPT